MLTDMTEEMLFDMDQVMVLKVLQEVEVEQVVMGKMGLIPVTQVDLEKVEMVGLEEQITSVQAQMFYMLVEVVELVHIVKLVMVDMEMEVVEMQVKEMKMVETAQLIQVEVVELQEVEIMVMGQVEVEL